MGFETEAELTAALNALPLDDEQKRATVCAWLGHSRIQDVCFGYYSCNRCGAQIGDALGGVYDDSRVVVVGHDCDVCRANYAELDWRDLLFTVDPFEKDNALAVR